MSFIFWCLGFFTSTFDLLLTFDIGHFTVKSSQIFFLLSFICIPTQQIWNNKYFSLRPPWLPIFLLIFYSFCLAGFSYNPIKSFAYTIWLVFDLVAIIFPVFFFSRLYEKNISNLIFITLFFLASITLIDYFAYYFGYKEGLIGYNHDRLLNWGASRPHAFSFEPSYLAIYFTSLSGFIFFTLYHPQAQKFSKAFLYALFTLSLAALFATGSRSGWMATLLLLSLGAILLRFRLKFFPRSWLVISIAAATSLSGIYLLLPEPQKEMMRYRLFSEVLRKKDGPTSARIQSMKNGIKMAQHTQYVGTGLGASYAYWVQNFEPEWRDLESKNPSGEVVMSIWAQLFAELGFFGLSMFFIFSFLMLWLIWQSPAGFWRDYSLCAAFVFFLFSAHWLGNFARIDVWVWYAIWFLPIVFGQNIKSVSGKDSQ